MKAVNREKSQIDLIDEVISSLQERLPVDWSVERKAREIKSGSGPPELVDSLAALQAPNGTFATLIIEARQSFTPREATTLLTRPAQLAQSIRGNVPVLVAAPWLSERSQDLLEREGFNYLDTTGNVFLRLDNPAVYVRTTGSSRNPEPRPRGSAQLTGPKAARLIRLLVDVSPPYGVRQLADAAGLTPGYVSQLLDTLDREALIERSDRGGVEHVHIEPLLRRWATTYDVFKSNETTGFICPTGIGGFLRDLAADPSTAAQTVITGSVAAAQLAPVTAPATLLAYCDVARDLADRLDLLPTDEGANVISLRPFDPIVWERTSPEGSLLLAAASQVAVDCLTGNGRMPAEGEALLAWMIDNESVWRLPSLDSLSPVSS